MIKKEDLVFEFIDAKKIYIDNNSDKILNFILKAILFLREQACQKGKGDLGSMHWSISIFWD